MRRLILVEGLPGSGKTTLSKKITDYMSLKGNTKLYQEGEGHPTDLAWCACIPVEQLASIMKKYPDYEVQMKTHMFIDNGYAVVPYTQFPIEEQSFFQLMESYEVYDNRVGFETFSELHIVKWKKFGEKAKKVDELTVFECAFLQNHINELLLFHCMSEEQIEAYLLKLINTVKELNPILIYLNQSNVYEGISRASDTRINEAGEKVWMERVIQYIQNSPYGIAHSLRGFEGMVSYFEARKEIELKILSQLPIETYVINNTHYNWEEIWNEIRAILD